ncbi:trypsin-like peptidase domain-containing protein [Candidatus Bathyarchaeota archaeon]|nr:trypsin-like peptidase domain-containing protein [Candidatus Bathyarchaeota archaeon]
MNIGESTVLLAIVVLSLFFAVILGYSVGYMSASRRINDLESQIQKFKDDLSRLNTSLESLSASTQNATVFVLERNISLTELYERVKNSIVVVRGLILRYDIFGRPYYVGQVQGSGFVYNFTGRMVIITNYHVVSTAVNITVTFANGNGYAAYLLGSDPYADLAVLSANAPENEYYPLEIASSSNLKVGDLVIAIGSPFGLTGSMSVGVVSALGRTITEETTGGYPIADVIQTTAPLNPGNSGGPLLNYDGQVVGITTAIVSGSQGISFAIPSNTILREIESLVTEGSYNKHPWLGVFGIDMTYEIAKAMNVNVTYGWLITKVVNGGPADKAGLRGGTTLVYIAGERITIGGDIIIAINDKRIVGIDDLSSYLEENTKPGQIINVTIIRGNEKLTLPVTLEARPPPS